MDHHMVMVVQTKTKGETHEQTGDESEQNRKTKNGQSKIKND